MPSSRDTLFDLAVNRAGEVAARLAAGDEAGRRRALEVWYLKTRFAYRVPFEALLAALARRPHGAVHWAGGERGGWRPGPPDRP
ncbi:MAG TPA: hypothetical protein VKB31_00335 [Trueperaceae bacterium]|nr:hypothetical protein [Trueperaceae bacterium]